MMVKTKNTHCRWAVESMEACFHVDWPAELLETELGEEAPVSGMHL